MTRYKQIYNEMYEANKKLFQEFEKVHANYLLNPETHQEELNQKGKVIIDIVKKYEDRLCGKSEESGYGLFSGKLAEKFQAEVRKHFPKIDYVGVKIKNQGFSLKKITPTNS